MDKQEKALEIFSNGFNCAQAVLAPFVQELNLDENTALRLSSGFGAGCARQGETCGAVSGAIMVLGLLYGRDNLSGMEAKSHCYEKSIAFSKAFKEKQGSLICRELLNIDMTDEQVWEKADKEGKFVDICPRMVQTAVEILEAQLLQH